ncbi:MAG: YncE family protein [Moheibacter sp.]
MRKLNLYVLLAISIFTISCNNDDDNEVIIEGDFVKGTFVLNEGNFGAGNASISFISETGIITDNIFASVNNQQLGDVAQSMYFEDDLAYIIINNSNTIEIVNRYTFESVATIAGGLQNPRYMEIYNGKGYVSNWGDAGDTSDDFIAVIDLATNTVTSTISVAEGPENLTEENGKLYVAHQGGWGFGNSISIIELGTNSLTSTLTLSDVPSVMEEEDGYLFVLCSGKASWTGDETIGAMYKINLQNNQVVDEFEFPIGTHPSYMQIEDDVVYYTVGSDIYKTNVADIELQNTSFISTSENGMENLYGFNVDEGWIYICDSKDYISTGELFVYSLDGNLNSQYPINGIIPKAVYFND